MKGVSWRGCGEQQDTNNSNEIKSKGGFNCELRLKVNAGEGGKKEI